MLAMHIIDTYSVHFAVPTTGNKSFMLYATHATTNPFVARCPSRQHLVQQSEAQWLTAQSRYCLIEDDVVGDGVDSGPDLFRDKIGIIAPDSEDKFGRTPTKLGLHPHGNTVP
jgi:hypothetical protein